MNFKISNRAFWVSVPFLALTLTFACFKGTRAQEGHLGHGHDKWHKRFFMTPFGGPRSAGYAASW